MVIQRTYPETVLGQRNARIDQGETVCSLRWDADYSNKMRHTSDIYVGLAGLGIQLGHGTGHIEQVVI